ncbi:MAG: DUF1738 domain-containing protein [Lewinellaceae bacterium]|nr:DUF1738 domain-containing protein [Saprospiraceae bacterium]MCB9338450.1 DUF1738 domain-containing protein [Lewinellaceae bacterium]
MKTDEIYDEVTKTITGLLEEHQQTWERPWIAFGLDNDHARNPVTAQYYRGVNQFILSCRLLKKGYLKNMWLTFNQIKQKGGAVKKGEKSTTVIFYKTAYVDRDKNYHRPAAVEKMGSAQMEARGITAIPVLRLYRVFNILQTTGLNEEWYEAAPHEPLRPFEKDEQAEDLIWSTGAKIEIIQSDRAFYDRARDRIVMPLREQFTGTEPFYSVALHELAHWTGHKSRLDRVKGKSFGDPDYALEEMVAELTGAFCCAALGFSKTITNNAAYIGHWLGILKKDNRAFMRAAAQAQKAADFILECRERRAVEGTGQYTFLNY